MRAQVLFPTLTTYGRLYCAPRRLHRYNNSSSQFLKLNLSRFSGGLFTAFFHMEVFAISLTKVVSAVILCLLVVSTEIYSSDDATDSICLETLDFDSIWPEVSFFYLLIMPKIAVISDYNNESRRRFY